MTILNNDIISSIGENEKLTKIRALKKGYCKQLLETSKHSAA